MFEIVWPITPETTSKYADYANLSAPQIDAIKYLHEQGHANEIKTQEELQAVYDSLPADSEWVCSTDIKDGAN